MAARVLGRADDGARARAAQHLVRRERHDVGERHRAGDGLAGDQADEVGGVDPEDRADLVGDGPEALEVDQPRDGRAAGEDHLGAVLAGELLDLVVVDVLGVLVDAVVHGVEPLAAERHLGAVGEVAAVRQAHREDLLARLEEGAVDGLVGAGPGVRLHVGVVGAEERLAPLDGEQLGLVDLAAAAVVAAPGVALGVLVRQRRAERGEHLGAGEVLARDELEAAAQAVELGEQHPRDVGVEGLEGAEVGSVERVSHRRWSLAARWRWTRRAPLADQARRARRSRRLVGLVGLTPPNSRASARARSTTSMTSASEIAPTRRKTGSSRVQSTMVDASPPATGPPSR